ncbi:MAG: hypothetical protein VX397_03310 [Pseudomonadota bacterium]|nr:hypothetical protein [Pseudomonadota bacterium]
MSRNEQKSRQIVAKGKRPYFLNDPASDKLLAMITALVGEFSVLKDRIDTHECLASEGKVATRENIENFIITDEIELRRDLMRQEILDRVFRIIKNQDLGSWEDKGEIYDGIIKKFSKE